MTDTKKQKMIERVQALLAKAEATPYPEEAAAFTAKAQTIMAEYAIDEALLTRGQATDITSLMVEVENPYWKARAQIINHVASANRCVVVWHTAHQMVHVFGVQSDIDAAMMLAQSLANQAQREMLAMGRDVDGWGVDHTKSFRRAFLLAFADRIYVRLLEANDNAVRDSGHASDLLPVLVEREQKIAEAVTDKYPRMGKHSLTASNGLGQLAGDRAGKRADLGQARISGTFGALNG